MARATQEYLGSYRLLNMIRAGKACQIWEALHDSRTQKFALKVLRNDAAKNRAEVAYMRHEFAVGRPFDHPRVIRSYELGVDRGNHYLVMDLCAAPNLKQAILQGVEPLWPKAKQIIEQAAEGLEYVHKSGWIHRDIKPDNFLVTAAGNVKLIDFALAQRVRSGLMRLIPAWRSKAIQGTRSYMSPEQIRGKPLSPRSDLYSFGCMLYELLSGKPPFTGVSTNDLLNKHLKNPAPSLQASNRNVTDAFANLVRTMVAKQPAQRPESMGEFLKAFRQLELFKEPPLPPK